MEGQQRSVLHADGPQGGAIDLQMKQRTQRSWLRFNGAIECELGELREQGRTETEQVSRKGI